VTYHSATNTQLYSQWYGGTIQGWNAPEAIPNALSDSTPAVVWNEPLEAFFMFFRGTDDALYLAYQEYGGDWTDPALINYSVQIGSGPSVQVLSNGDMQIAMRDVFGDLWYIEYYAASHTWDGPTQDITNTDIDTPPQLVGQQANSIWTLISRGGEAWWKLSMRENSLGGPGPSLTTDQLSAARAAFEQSLTSAATR
jgi:hypothetical protein